MKFTSISCRNCGETLEWIDESVHRYKCKGNAIPQFSQWTSSDTVTIYKPPPQSESDKRKIDNARQLSIDAYKARLIDKKKMRSKGSLFYYTWNYNDENSETRITYAPNKETATWNFSVYTRSRVSQKDILTHKEFLKQATVISK